MNTVQIMYVVAAKMDLEKLALFTAGETKRFKLYYCLSKQIACKCLRYATPANVIFVYVLGNSYLHLPVNQDVLSPVEVLRSYPSIAEFHLKMNQVLKKWRDCGRTQHSLQPMIMINKL